MTDGLILAAGAGSRFGHAVKQLALLEGRPLLQWAVEAQTQVDPALIDRVVVVLGAHAAEIRRAVDFGRAETVVCEEWADGQSASLHRGLAALTGATRVLVTLGDVPLLSPEAIALIAAEPAPARAVYTGHPGHPVLLGPEQIAALSVAGGDRGARGLLADARRIEAGHLCSGRDVDTPEDLEEIRHEARAII